MQGRWALVTGASGGIGAAIAEALAAKGLAVAVHYHSGQERAEAVRAGIEARGGEARLVRFDVTDAVAVREAVRGLLAEDDRIAVLVNNAGVSRDSLLLDQPAEDWEACTRTTLDGFYHVTRALLLPMVRRRWGRIINVSSVVGQVGNPGQVAYAAGRAGLIGATRALAREVASHGITVNALAPGMIDTPMLRAAPDRGHRAAVGRLGTPHEVGALAAFLASDDAAYITGQVITIDGGLT